MHERIKDVLAGGKRVLGIGLSVSGTPQDGTHNFILTAGTPFDLKLTDEGLEVNCQAVLLTREEAVWLATRLAELVAPLEDAEQGGTNHGNHRSD